MSDPNTLPPQPLVTTTTVYPIGNGCNNADNALLTGKGVMPGHFYPTASGNAFSMNRKAYMRTASTRPVKPGPNNIPGPKGKPIDISDSSSRTMMLRFNAVGKSSVNNSGGELAFSGEDKNVVNRALSRARKIGGAAPPKKGLKK
jgi:hypothetical protein